MFRFLIACVFYTTVAKWGYAEFSMMFPSAKPLLDKSLAHLEIPTTDRWSKESVHNFIEQVSDYAEQANEAFLKVSHALEERRG